MQEDLMKQPAQTPAFSSVTSIEQQRAVQEVQGMMIMAKKFPRNEDQVIEKIKMACKRKSLAEGARYVYPRAGTTIQGPSIRLAEAIARIWGNMLYGIQELGRKPGSSEMEAYAWDLESNTRRSIRFQVEHSRYTKKGTYTLEDPRDIYEMTANMGARRVRACIQGVIPGDVFDMAEEECDRTLNSAQEGPIEDRIKAMIAKYAEISVPVAAIEKRLGHKIDATTSQEIIVLRKIFISIRDGMGKKEDYFELASMTEQKTEEKMTELAERLAKAKETEAPAGATGPLDGPKPGVKGTEATPGLQPPPTPGPGQATPPVGEMAEPPQQGPPDPPQPPQQGPPDPYEEEEPPPPPPPPDPWGKNKKADGGPRREKGVAIEKYWLSDNMVKCPPGGERDGAMTNVKGFCNTGCKYRKKCFLFKD